MDADAWGRLRTTSRRHQPRFDMFLGFEEAEGSGDEEARADFPCPFCADEFDLVGLCCHIDDEHPLEAKAGVCPICSDRVGMDLVGHITMQHPGFFKRRRKHRRGSSGSHSTLALLRKDLHEGKLHSLFTGSSHATPPSTIPDPLLSSFINSFTEVDLSKDALQGSLDERNKEGNSLEQKAVESDEPPLPEEDKEERIRRSQFMQGLVLSTIFDDML